MDGLSTPAAVRDGPPAAAVPGPRGGGRRRPLPLRRPPPLDEARDAPQPHGPDPVPDRGRGHVAASATSRASSSPRATRSPSSRSGRRGCSSSRTTTSRRRASSRPARRRDFTTDLGVFQNGMEIARKTIRVNDPLEVDGYSFHQNGFGAGAGPPDQRRGGQAALGRPGAADRPGERPPVRHAVRAGPRHRAEPAPRSARPTARASSSSLPYRVDRRGDATASRRSSTSTTRGRGRGGRGAGPARAGLLGRRPAVLRLHPADRQEGPGAGDRLDARSLLLIIGLAITFYLPRRRIWARLAPAGELRLVARSDRYVDLEREFGTPASTISSPRRRRPPAGPAHRLIAGRADADPRHGAPSRWRPRALRAPSCRARAGSPRAPMSRHRPRRPSISPGSG